MPEMPDVVPGADVEADWGNLIRSRTVQRYASVATRSAQNPAPQDGDLSFLADSGLIEYWDGAAWTQLTVPADLTAALADYLTIASAAATYLPLTGGTLTDALGIDIGGQEVMQFLSTAVRFGGTTTGRARIEFTNGDPGVVTYAFSGDSDSGMYRSAANTINFATAGVSRMLVGSSGTVVVESGDFRISTDPTTGDAANANINASTGRVTRSTSAKRYKKNIQPLGILDALVPVSFTHKGSGKDYLGFIADDLAELDPRLGEFSDDGVIENYDLRGVVAVLAAQVNELRDQLQALVP